MKVTVVILNFNDSDTTKKCARSVERAIRHLDSSHAATIILVDNGSQPRLAQEAPELLRIKDLSIVENPHNLGFAGGMNSGLRLVYETDSDAVWLLNNDVVVEPQSLAALCNFKKANSGKLCIGAVIIDQSTGKVQTIGGYRYNTLLGFARPFGKSLDAADLPKTQPKIDYVDGSALFIDVNILKDIGGIPAQNFLFYEELNLTHALGGKHNLAVCLEAIVKHKGGASTEKLVAGSKTYHSTLAALRYTRHHLKLAVPIVFLLRLTVALYRDFGMRGGGHARNAILAGKEFIFDSQA